MVIINGITQIIKLIIELIPHVITIIIFIYVITPPSMTLLFIVNVPSLFIIIFIIILISPKPPIIFVFPLINVVDVIHTVSDLPIITTTTIIPDNQSTKTHPAYLSQIVSSNCSRNLSHSPHYYNITIPPQPVSYLIIPPRI